MEPDEETVGAIDTGDKNAGPDQAPVPDNSPAIPVEDDATGVNEAQQPIQPQQPQQPGYGPLGAIGGGRSVGTNAKAIVAYLMGAGASHPATLDEAGKQVDPNGEMSPSDRNMYALSRIRDTEGDNAAWAIMQANRLAYNAKTAFSKTALTGNGQKPANLHAALQAANDAQTHVLDGSNVVFALHNGQVTATVTDPGSTQQRHINLSPQAFAQYLDVGGDGQWDKVMDQSAPAVLQRLAAQQQQAAPQVAQGAPRAAQAPRYRPGGSLPQPQQEDPGAAPEQPQQQPQAPQAPQSEAVRSGQPVEYSQDAYPDAQMPRRGGASGKGAGNQPAIPGTHDRNGHYIGPQAEQEGAYSPELEARSQRMFPGVSQEQERQQWLAGQEQQGAKNAIEDKKASHDWTVESSRIRAAGGVEAARVKAEGAARQQQQKAMEVATKMANDNKNQKMREDGRNARAIIGSQNWLVQTDAERDKVLKRFGINVPLEVETEPAPAAAKPTEDRREYKGEMYTREEYESKFGKH